MTNYARSKPIAIANALLAHYSQSIITLITINPMATKMTINGCSTTTAPGCEQYERYLYGIGRKKKAAYQYDYRHTNGVLFSCCAPTLEACRERRNEWLTKNNL